MVVGLLTIYIVSSSFMYSTGLRAEQMDKCVLQSIELIGYHLTRVIWCLNRGDFNGLVSTGGVHFLKINCCFAGLQVTLSHSADDNPPLCCTIVY